MKTTDLSPQEFDPYYGGYIDLANQFTLREGFAVGKDTVIDFFKAIPAEKHNFRYAADKWSIKEVFQHIIDTERVFIYRAFRIARTDQTPLANFDQNIYIVPSQAQQKTMEQLISEYECCRIASISLINSLSDEDLCRLGVLNDQKLSARAIAFCTLGHELWHIRVIKERYL